MAHLNQDQLREIGLSAARQVVGAGVDAVDVKPGIDASDRRAYFISYRFQDDRDRARASLLRTRLTQSIRDELIRRGDATYPFVRLLLAIDWERRGDAGPG